jgi:O-antigen/teichoic acid export membrane protein
VRSGLHHSQRRHPRTSVRRQQPSTHTAEGAASAQGSSQGAVRKAGFTVLMGSGLGSAIGLLVTPLITRIFDPVVYGRFALITGVVSVFVGVSTFRFEVRSLRAADDAEATGLIRLGLIASVAWGAVLTLAACLAVSVWHLNSSWLATGVLVFLASLQLLGTATLTRARRYRSLAAANFVQGASLGVIQLLLGLVSAGVGALLAGFGAARLGWLPALRRSRHDVPGVATLWRENRRFAALAGSSAFLNSLTTSAPVLMVSVFYGDAAVGQLAIGVRLLVTPLSVIGQAAAMANLGEVSRMLRLGDDAAARLVKQGMRDLLAIGLIPCGLAGALGAWAVPFVLGKEWREAGLLFAALAAGALAQFVVAPFAQLLNVTGDNRRLLMWDTGRFGATVLSFCVVWAAGMSPVWAVGAWSVALVVLYGALAGLVLRTVARYRAPLKGETRPPPGGSAAGGLPAPPACALRRLGDEQAMRASLLAIATGRGSTRS